jgi:hypothetical protein
LNGKGNGFDADFAESADHAEISSGAKEHPAQWKAFVFVVNNKKK